MSDEDEDPSKWPDYLPEGWIDEPASPIDPIAVVVWVVFVALVVLAAVLYVRV